MERQTPVGSFFRFVSGFILFIVLSFGITIVVNTYAMSQQLAQTAAAARAALIAHPANQ
jgi:hypothetical protein